MEACAHEANEALKQLQKLSKEMNPVKTAIAALIKRETNTPNPKNAAASLEKIAARLQDVESKYAPFCDRMDYLLEHELPASISTGFIMKASTQMSPQRAGQRHESARRKTRRESASLGTSAASGSPHGGGGTSGFSDSSGSGSPTTSMASGGVSAHAGEHAAIDPALRNSGSMAGKPASSSGSGGEGGKARSGASLSSSAPTVLTVDPFCPPDAPHVLGYANYVEYKQMVRMRIDIVDYFIQTSRLTLARHVALQYGLPLFLFPKLAAATLPQLDAIQNVTAAGSTTTTPQQRSCLLSPSLPGIGITPFILPAANESDVTPLQLPDAEMGSEEIAPEEIASVCILKNHSVLQAISFVESRFIPLFKALMLPQFTGIAEQILDLLLDLHITRLFQLYTDESVSQQQVIEYLSKHILSHATRRPIKAQTVIDLISQRQSTRVWRSRRNHEESATNEVRESDSRPHSPNPSLPAVNVEDSPHPRPVGGAKALWPPLPVNPRAGPVSSSRRVADSDGDNEHDECSNDDVGSKPRGKDAGDELDEAGDATQSQNDDTGMNAVVASTLGDDWYERLSYAFHRVAIIGGAKVSAITNEYSAFWTHELSKHEKGKLSNRASGGGGGEPGSAVKDDSASRTSPGSTRSPASKVDVPADSASDAEEEEHLMPDLVTRMVAASVFLRDEYIEQLVLRMHEEQRELAAGMNAIQGGSTQNSTSNTGRGGVAGMLWGYLMSQPLASMPFGGSVPERVGSLGAPPTPPSQSSVYKSTAAGGNSSSNNAAGNNLVAKTTPTTALTTSQSGSEAFDRAMMAIAADTLRHNHATKSGATNAAGQPYAPPPQPDYFKTPEEILLADEQWSYSVLYMKRPTRFYCGVTGECLDGSSDDKTPIALPNGVIVSKRAISACLLTTNRGDNSLEGYTMVKCPFTGEVFRHSQIRRIFVT